jgi:hypothetical protein
MVQQMVGSHQPIGQVVTEEGVKTWSGTHVCLMPNVGASVEVLRQHFQCKKHKPLETSALVVIPEADHARCTHLLANMCCYGQHQLQQNTDNNYWVYKDNTDMQPGILTFANLPEPLKLFHIDATQPTLTFIFKAQIAGLKCTCLWDSGATKSFVANDFAVQNSLPVSSDTCKIILADGSIKETKGQCAVQLQLQKHNSDVQLHVTDLVNGFDVILGNDWS